MRKVGTFVCLAVVLIVLPGCRTINIGGSGGVGGIYGSGGVTIPMPK